MRPSDGRLAALLFLAAFAGAMPVARAQDQLPATTLSCENFKKNPDGSWSVANDKPFTIGATMVTVGTGTIVRPGSVTLEDADFYNLLEARCSGPR